MKNESLLSRFCILPSICPSSPSNEVGPWSKPRDGFAAGPPRRGWRSGSVSVLQSYGLGPPRARLSAGSGQDKVLARSGLYTQLPLIPFAR